MDWRTLKNPFVEVEESRTQFLPVLPDFNLPWEKMRQSERIADWRGTPEEDLPPFPPLHIYAMEPHIPKGTTPSEKEAILERWVEEARLGPREHRILPDDPMAIEAGIQDLLEPFIKPPKSSISLDLMGLRETPQASSKLIFEKSRRR